MAGLDVEPPESFKLPLVINPVDLFGPGPANCSPRVLHALSLPPTEALMDVCYEVMDEIKSGLQYIFQTKNEATLVVTGSGNAGIEMSLVNLLEPGDRLLVAVNGNWSYRAIQIAQRGGSQIFQIKKEIGEVFSLEEIEAGLIEYKPKVLFIVHGESSTGVIQPLEGVGNLCHKYNCLVVVDAVISLGGIPLYTDRWNLDVVISATQKSLRVPPGLSPITFSPRAVECVRNRKTPVCVFFFDLLVLGSHWGCFGNPRLYHHTLPTNMYYGLREGIAEICEEGLEETWERQKECGELLREGLKKLGMELFVTDQSITLPTVATIKLPLPGNINEMELFQYMLDKYSTRILWGAGPTFKKVMRIGSLGYNAYPAKIRVLIENLAEAFEHFGVKVDNIERSDRKKKYGVAVY